MTATPGLVREGGKCYRLVPPDGGWGYMVAVALVIVMTSVTAPMSCFGIIYGDFLDDIGVSTSGIGLQNGLAFLSFTLSAFLCNIALKRFTLRAVGALGAALYSVGTFGGIFVNSLLTLILTSALLSGIGSGLMMTCILTAFNMYFVKKRVFVMSLCQTVICVVSIVIPMLISAFKREFGFRGTLALLCGLALQTLVAFTMLQPVERHLVMEEVQEHETTVYELEPLTSKGKEVIVTNMGDHTTHAAEKITAKKSTLRKVVDYLDLSLLRDPVLLNVCVGESMVLVSDTTFFTLLPLHLYQVHWTTEEVAFMLTLLLLGDAVARAALAVVSHFYSVNSRKLFLAGAFGMTILRFGMLTPRDVNVVTALCTVIGFFRCFVMVTYPLVVADYAPADKYPAAQGLQLLMSGLLSFAAGPLAGIIKDVSGSYLPAFHMLTGTMLLCLVPWSLEMIFTRKKKEHTITNTIIINEKAYFLFYYVNLVIYLKI